MTLSIDEIKSKLQQELSEHRYAHSIGTADTARLLASIYGENEDKAYLAGLIHDCGKPYADALSHARMGAEIACEQYGIEDQEILNAIKYHTLGHAPMTTLEKIIFISDKIEPTRDYPGVDAIREAAKTGLNKAIVMSIKSTIDNLDKEGRTIDVTSDEVYNYYRRLVKYEQS